MMDDFPDVLARARAKARERAKELADARKAQPQAVVPLEDRLPPTGQLAALVDRFMKRGPAQFRVVDDKWWQR